MVKHNVHASVKDEKLVALRREQMIKGAVQLFKQKDFRVQQREIAKAAGFSIGTLYEYIRTKDDVLYLVCDSIYEHVKKKIRGSSVYRKREYRKFKDSNNELL